MTSKIALSLCPVCKKKDEDHTEEQSERCDRIFSRRTAEMKQQAWKVQRNWYSEG